MSTEATADLALASVVAGPARPLRVAVSTRQAVYLSGPERSAPPVCALVEAEGVAVPHAIRLPRGVRWESVVEHDGEPVLLGDGRLRGPGLELVVRPAHDTTVPTPSPGAPAGAVAARAADRLASARAALLGPGTPAPERTGGWPGLPHRWSAGAATLACLLADAPALLGRGPGLTPTGDDLTAGALLVHRLLGTPGTDDAAAALSALAAQRTTAASALMIRAAGEGRAAPPVRRAVAVLLQDDEPAAPALHLAVAGLLALGHTSGADLADGLHDGLQAIAARTPPVARTSPAPLPPLERNCA